MDLKDKKILITGDLAALIVIPCSYHALDAGVDITLVSFSAGGS